jgi:hypothetical protein
MLQATRKQPCKCFICKATISTTEGYADKVQKNKYECLKCVGVRLVRWGFKQVRISNYD